MDFFGETALINDAKRGATVTATGPVSTFYLERDDFEALFGKSRLNVQFAKRAAISAEQVKSGGADGAASTSAPPNAVRDKDHAAVHMISSVMKDNVVFMNLDAENKARIIAEMWRMTVPAGQVTVKQVSYQFISRAGVPSLGYANRLPFDHIDSLSLFVVSP